MSSAQHSYERVVTKKLRILVELSRPSDWPATVSQLASKLCATNNHLPPRGPTLLPGTPGHLASPFSPTLLSAFAYFSPSIPSPVPLPDNQSRSSYFRAIQPSPPVLPGLRLGSRCLIPREPPLLNGIRQRTCFLRAHLGDDNKVPCVPSPSY